MDNGSLLFLRKVQQSFLEGVLQCSNGSMKFQMGNNLFLTEMNRITISSADVKGKVMTVTEKGEMKTEANRKKMVEGYK